MIVSELCYGDAVHAAPSSRPDASTVAGGPLIAPAAPVPASLADETGYLLRRAYVRAGEWGQAVMPHDSPMRHYEVMQSLADLGPRSQHDLSELLWINRTIMVKLIDSLESPGLVERRRNPADRRSYALDLTASGRRRLAELSRSVERAEDGLTAGLADPQRRRLRELLTRIAHAGRSHQLPAGLAGRVSFLLGPAHHGVRERLNDRLAALGLTTALYGTLATIEARGPISQQAIADQLGLTGPAIVQTVDRLQAAGLVERRRDPLDRRSYALEPTATGLGALRNARLEIEQINESLDRALAGPRRRGELNGLLRMLLTGA
jgi:DNA-binding MarR family transcriptional regulator